MEAVERVATHGGFGQPSGLGRFPTRTDGGSELSKKKLGQAEYFGAMRRVE